ALLYVNAGLCERSKKVRVPILAVIDLGETITAVLDLIISPEQAAVVSRRLGRVASARIMMADGHIAEHFLEQVVEIGTARQTIKENPIFVRRGLKIQTVEIRVVEEITLDSPDFVVHLTPFGTGIYADLHLTNIQNTVAGFKRLSC